MTFGRSLGKFIVTSKAGTALYERCASETFSFHQSFSLRSVPQHELRHGHQLSLTVWAGFGFEPLLPTQTVSLSLSVTAQSRLEQFCKPLEGDEGSGMSLSLQLA